MTLVDTPGVLSGEKQKAREYDFRAVTKVGVCMGGDVLHVCVFCMRKGCRRESCVSAFLDVCSCVYVHARWLVRLLA